MIRKAVGAIVFQGERFLIVHKTNIHTKTGKKPINGEWDIVKGGVKSSDENLNEAILRELREETGSTQYQIVKPFEEKICFEFPSHIKEKIGYDRQETTVFLVEYIGSQAALQPIDNEISEIQFVEKNQWLHKLTHIDTREFVKKYLLEHMNIEGESNETY